MTGKHLAVVALRGLTLTSLTLSAGAQTLQPAASEIVFVSKQMGVPVEGRFKSFSLPGFRFDPRKPDTAQVAIQIDEMSIRCGHEQPAEAQYDADGHQREEERQAAGQR